MSSSDESCSRHDVLLRKSRKKARHDKSLDTKKAKKGRKDASSKDKKDRKRSSRKSEKKEKWKDEKKGRNSEKKKSRDKRKKRGKKLKLINYYHTYYMNIIHYNEKKKGRREKTHIKNI